MHGIPNLLVYRLFCVDRTGFITQAESYTYALLRSEGRKFCWGNPGRMAYLLNDDQWGRTWMVYNHQEPFNKDQRVLWLPEDEANIPAEIRTLLLIGG